MKSSYVKIDGDRIQIDPLVLFQRLTTAYILSCSHLVLVFKHELCSYPPALFDSSLLLHEADKQILADAIWKICENGVPADIPFSMSWIVEHFYNASHGLTVLHIETSPTSTQNM